MCLAAAVSFSLVAGMPARMEQQLQQQQQPSTSQRCGVACDLEFLHQCLQDEVCCELSWARGRGRQVTSSQRMGMQD